MRIHVFQHVPFEGPANIEKWSNAKGHLLTKTALFAGEALPDINTIDWLVLLGGPMNVDEEERYPWLSGEKRFIEQAIRKNKVTLGVCLGAQLIASVLGARVTKNREREIGWFPIELTQEGRSSFLFRDRPQELMAFHWHGDTFELPNACVRLAFSDGCDNQGFLYGSSVIGLQFHLESTPESIRNLIASCGNEISKGKFIQSAEEMLAQSELCGRMEPELNLMLDRIEEKTNWFAAAAPVKANRRGR